MICPKCSTEIKEGMIFCPNCCNPIMRPQADEKNQEYPFAIELDVDGPEYKKEKKINPPEKKDADKKLSKKHISVIAVVLAIAILIPTVITAVFLVSNSKDENDPPENSIEYLTEDNSKIEETVATTDLPEETTLPEKTVDYLEPTDEDWLTLERNLSGWCYGEDLYIGVVFDSQSPVAGEMAYGLICKDGGSLMYSSYFDDEVEKYIYQSDWQSDPLNLCDDGSGDSGYYKFSADNLDWIIENVFNTTPNRDIKSVSTAMGINPSYYYGDDFYYQVHGGYGDDFRSYTVVDKTKLSDGTYEITVSVNDISDYENPVVVARIKVVAGVKETDGKRYWSYSKIEA